MQVVTAALTEDYERLYARWLSQTSLSDDEREFSQQIATFTQTYTSNRDALSQSDADRAFFLVAQAASLLDYEVYHNSPDAEETTVKIAQEYLNEAIKLDPNCHDAERMMQLLSHLSRDQLTSWLRNGAQAVHDCCLARAYESGQNPKRGAYSESVYMRPYLRWLVQLANEELNCGRYRCTHDVCMQILDLDATDFCGARFIDALVCAKLENLEYLEALKQRFPHDSNAWFALATCFILFKQRKLQEAAKVLHEIVQRFDQSGHTLVIQEELPAAFFNVHLIYEPGSADELFVAMSEATIVLDENAGDFVSALSAWIASDPVVVAQLEQEEAAFGELGEGGVITP